MSAKVKTVNHRMFLLDQLMDAAIARMRAVTASMSPHAMEAEFARPQPSVDEADTDTGVDRRSKIPRR